MAVSIGICVTLAGVLFAGPVVRMLGAGPSFEQLAESYLRIRVLAATAVLVAWLAAVQPLSALAFTLDGILIGASDTRVLAKSMVASSLAYAAISLLALELGWGTAGLAVGATVWILLRTATTAWRWRGGRWMLVA